MSKGLVKKKRNPKDNITYEKKRGDEYVLK